ncbi:hypothetical protein BH11MYX1_BH11MYX1_34650 [soil metagenome]
MTDSDELVGFHGEGWCVVPPGSVGPPDQMDELVMRWLLIPGPPMSCTLVHQFAVENPAERVPYHLHTDTWSIHVCIGGRGKHYANGRVSDVVPGTMFYECPNVPHTVIPDPGEYLTQINVQYPGLGYEGETKIVPEAGTLDRFGDLEAFLKTFGADAANYKNVPQLFKSPRWMKFVSNPQRPK